MDNVDRKDMERKPMKPNREENYQKKKCHAQ
jgi:hypothetical protein